MRTVCATLLLPLLLAPMGVTAATIDGKYATYATGAEICSDVLSELNNQNQSELISEVSVWLSGYISAQNRLTKSAYDVIPVMNHPALAVLALRLCEVNPNAKFETIAGAILEEFAPVRVESEVGGEVIEGDGFAVGLRAGTVQKMQLTLIDLDYLEAGEANGDFGPRTASAVLSWQEDNGLQLTGTFDPITLFSLLQAAK